MKLRISGGDKHDKEKLIEEIGAVPSQFLFYIQKASMSVRFRKRVIGFSLCHHRWCPPFAQFSLGSFREVAIIAVVVMKTQGAQKKGEIAHY